MMTKRTKEKREWPSKEENWEEEDVYVKNEEEKDVEKEVYEDEEDGEEERVSSCLFTIVKTI